MIIPIMANQLPIIVQGQLDRFLVYNS